ncbi:MAG: DUF4199 domain-containing protein [Prevotella sp.]|jgi:hypothetical protein|nr:MULTISPECIES: DUF4199 domain-containing protein [unclassified Prevotella]MCH3970272.1 DUF4199 domain-containing protein [Prevotella sp.]MCH3992373.1 DUF4199 domain-containing protein [Prevotella sp.]MCH4017023.1 DUF4199 domain-containing protein [Prevotella sp.]MCH4100056.1 DUF4199 domain-containing protein [Prevotella sp.]MCH4185402.1 DUF4199 domain-containing protein [Prevotella sp.]
MITSQNITQVRAFARQDGAFLSVLWIAGFLCTMLAVRMPLLAPVGDLAVLATPFFVAFRLKRFRDGALDGVISFRRGLLYTAETFFHAALIMGVVQYLYFKFGDISGFLQQWNESYSIIAKVYNLNAAQAQQLKEAVSMMSPLAWASMFFILELFGALIASPIIAAIMARPVSHTHIQDNHSDNN